ncbi:DsbA family protein [Sphingorhabdus contaminans]|jgi:protein-disulfide isomerase|uniref:DsbA family protein n=1 Tax=Sphingorhabdus contaminans TaxID=1343899 RepID=UPI003D26D27D
MRIKSLFITAAAALALAACGSGDSAGAPKGEPIAKVAAPAGKAWTDVVTKTEVGGYKMGNPDAKLQLVEYGAITCPGCAQFSVQSTEELNEIVNTGVVAMEFRPYLVHGVQDIPGFLLAACSGPEAFFPLTEQLYAEQQSWLSKISTVTEADQQAMQKMTPEQISTLLGTKMGLIDFVKSRGISEDQAKSCLSDKAAIDALIASTERGTKEDGVTGTPFFLLNGAKLDASSWNQVKGKLVEAGAR